MNREFYSDKTVEKFLKDKVCHRDALLYKYYTSDDVAKFRRRLEILEVPHKDIEKVMYTFVTDSIRYIILKTVGDLTKFLQPMGDLIISGGEAFNFYFDRDSRVVTSDIDTKFVPRFQNKKFFENLQITKLILWDKLGSLANGIESKVRERLTEVMKGNRFVKMYGFSLPKTNPIVMRRYTLIKKSKQTLNNDTSITPKNVLIDVELFTLDLTVRYFSTKSGSIQKFNMGGILDMAFMRPGELGYEVTKGVTRGLVYKNHDTDKYVYNPNLIVAGKKFLLEDLYIMQTLGLRPEKKNKDRKRMFEFSKKILGLKDVSSKDTIDTLFKKSLKVVKNDDASHSSKPKKVFGSLLGRARKVNPLEWSERTTVPSRKKVVSQFLVGLRGPRGLNIKNYKRTSGDYRFNIDTQLWKKNTSPYYVKNEYNYRPTKNVNVNFSKVQPTHALYGYNPKRNKNMPSNIINKASLIPLVGLKNLNVNNAND